ncbi:Response regulator protein VraR [Rubripirellula obstinata]|uniref:Response regulator protein VraR n=1 Tax=Rubripirellula obstinata TaxID=406547 RepID=A0A5B1CIJ5_9BACT|nr:response regulator transcription factor [Rubripirellula obstinata]KAA1259253.1 Response regulator protein VraR [Rubripirellula obstinata]
MTTKILIVDDHEAARLGLACILEPLGFEIVGSVATGDEAVEFVKIAALDMVLMDVRLQPGDGLTTLDRIRDHSDVAIVLMSAYDNPTYVARAAAMGAQDYLIKNGSTETLGDDLNHVLAGNGPTVGGRMEVIQREMQMKVDTNLLPPELPLTGREAQVLRHVALGLSNKEISKSLGISVETVKEHVQNVLRKIQATDRTDAAVRAIRLGLIA